MAKKHKRFDLKWGVVNGCNAICADVFDTKEQAEAYRKTRARAYSVVKVCITPLYQQDDE